MKKIVHYIGLDVHQETVGAAIAKNRFTRYARPAQPESEGDVVVRLNPGCRSQTRCTRGYKSFTPPEFRIGLRRVLRAKRN